MRPHGGLGGSGLLPCLCPGASRLGRGAPGMHGCRPVAALGTAGTSNWMLKCLLLQRDRTPPPHQTEHPGQKH